MPKKKRDAGEGTVYEYRGKYRAMFTTPEGKRISRIFEDSASAHAWLAVQRAELESGYFVEPSYLTVGQWSAQYLTTYCKPNVQESTYGLYKLTVKKLSPLSNIPLQKLNAFVVQKFLNELDVSENMRNKVYKFLNQMLNQAVMVNLVKLNIMNAVKAPQPEHTEIETFTAEELKQILATVSTSTYYKKYLPFFTLAICTGARLGELLGLRIGDVDATKIRIRSSLPYGRVTDIEERMEKRKKDVKTENSYRTITVGANVVALLQQAYRYEPIVVNGFVFHTENGTPISMRNMERTWEKVLSEAGIPYRKFHALRHTHATQLLGQGVPVLEVSKRLGHKKASTTLNIYGHTIKGYDENIPQIMDAILQ